jgi:hypothetical protein
MLPKAFSLELAIVIGLPLLTVVGGLWLATTAFHHGFTTTTEPAVIASPAR